MAIVLMIVAVGVMAEMILIATVDLAMIVATEAMAGATATTGMDPVESTVMPVVMTATAAVEMIDVEVIPIVTIGVTVVRVDAHTEMFQLPPMVTQPLVQRVESSNMEAGTMKTDFPVVGIDR